jgi:hypothetical protein
MKPKNLPRLWCALQGLLPLEACLAAQRGELAWPHEPAEPAVMTPSNSKRRIRIAVRQARVNVAPRGAV